MGLGFGAPDMGHWGPTQEQRRIGENSKKKIIF